MSEFPGDGNNRSPRPLPPLQVRMSGRFGLLEVVQGHDQPQSTVLYDVVAAYPKVGVVEVGWGVYGHRFFSDRWLITNGKQTLGQKVVVATTVMGDPDFDPAFEEPLELQLPSALAHWEAYALPDVGRWAMLHEHLLLSGRHMISAEIMSPNKVAGLYAGKHGLLSHLLGAVDLPR